MTNKYSEGYPGRRYYGGNEIIDQIENLARERALKAYRLDPNQWGVNVQPLSGSPANMEVYAGLLNPGDKIMGMSLYQGGHLSHSFETDNKKISVSSQYYNSKQYSIVTPGTYEINYDELDRQVEEFKPHMLIAGFSAYPQDLDWKRFRQAADKVGAYFLADMAHVSGLVAVQEYPNPFEYADIVTSTTHKTLRGPRGGVIWAKKDLMQRIDDAVFPGSQGGPHENQIGALAAQLHQVLQPEFKDYIL